MWTKQSLTWSQNISLWTVNPTEEGNDKIKYDPKIINQDNGQLLAYFEAKDRIIGNKKSMIYHLPSGKSYKKVILKNAVFFNSEEEEIAAGYRKAKN